jgi:hypothetical protein
VKKLLAAGYSVVGVDLIHQGEFLADGKPLEQAPKVKNPREAAAYTFGYNHSVFAQRVQDVLSVIAFVKHHERAPKRISLVGLEGSAGAWAAAARAQAQGTVDRAALNTHGFRFIEVDSIFSLDFLPGGAKYGDLPGMLALAAPHATWIAGETGSDLALVKGAYQAAGKPDQLTVADASGDAVQDAVVTWLTK